MVFILPRYVQYALTISFDVTAVERHGIDAHNLHICWIQGTAHKVCSTDKFYNVAPMRLQFEEALRIQVWMPCVDLLPHIRNIADDTEALTQGVDEAIISITTRETHDEDTPIDYKMHRFVLPPPVHTPPLQWNNPAIHNTGQVDLPHMCDIIS